MSYFGRVGARAGGARQAGLAPAGPLSSPYARIDQRLNLLARLGAPLDTGRLLPRDRGTQDGLEQDGANQPVAAPAPAAPATSALERMNVAPPPRSGQAPPPAPAPESRTTPPARSTTRDMALPVEAPREVRARVAATAPERQPQAPAPVPALDMPRVMREQVKAAVGETGRAARSSDAEAPARAVERRTRSEARTPAETADATKSALERALSQVERWMSQKPRRDPPPEPSRPAGEPPAVPTLTPAAGIREQAALAGVPATREAAPRLTIGSIDVRVIPPAPAPVVAVRQEPRRQGGHAAPRAAASSVPSHLTFGLRQR